MAPQLKTIKLSNLVFAFGQTYTKGIALVQSLLQNLEQFKREDIRGMGKHEITVETDTKIILYVNVSLSQFKIDFALSMLFEVLVSYKVLLSRNYPRRI